ncbi:putative small auxin-up RNA [Helianthus anomalus]
MKTGNKINQIVRLKQVVQRWRRRIPSSGSLAVYVGPEHKRFVIPTRFLNLPVFVSLLNKAEEEFGFQTTGGLVIPCDVVFFKKLVDVLERDERGFGTLDLDEFVEMFSDLTVDSGCCKNATISDSRIFTPLLQKTKV